MDERRCGEDQKSAGSVSMLESEREVRLGRMTGGMGIPFTDNRRSVNEGKSKFEEHRQNFP